MIKKLPSIVSWGNLHCQLGKILFCHYTIYTRNTAENEVSLHIVRMPWSEIQLCSSCLLLSKTSLLKWWSDHCLTPRQKRDNPVSSKLQFSNYCTYLDCARATVQFSNSTEESNHTTYTVTVVALVLHFWTRSQHGHVLALPAALRRPCWILQASLQQSDLCFEKGQHCAQSSIRKEMVCLNLTFTTRDCCSRVQPCSQPCKHSSHMRSTWRAIKCSDDLIQNLSWIHNNTCRNRKSAHLNAGAVISEKRRKKLFLVVAFRSHSDFPLIPSLPRNEHTRMQMFHFMYRQFLVSKLATTHTSRNQRRLLHRPPFCQSSSKQPPKWRLAVWDLETKWETWIVFLRACKSLLPVPTWTA